MVKRTGQLFTVLLMMLMLMCIKNDVLAASVLDSRTEGTISWTMYDDGTLKISGSGILNGNNCSYGSFKSKVKRVEIGNGITSIEDYAFDNFTELSGVEIPSSVTTIRWFCFHGCNNLKRVTIPNSVTTISVEAFSYCENLEYVNIPDSVKELGVRAFQNCKSLTTIDIPESVTEIGNDAFCRCESLSTVTIPERFNNSETMQRSFSGTKWALSKLGPLKGSVGDLLYTLTTDGTMTLSGSGVLKHDNNLMGNFANQVKTVIISADTSKIELDVDIFGGWAFLFHNIEKLINNSTARVRLYHETSDGYSWCNSDNKNERIFWMGKGTALRINKKLDAYVNILFDGNGSTSGSMAPIRAKADEKCNITNRFVKKGYKLSKWKNDIGASEYRNYVVISSSYLQYNDVDAVTLHADWKVDSSIGLSDRNVTMQENKTTTVSLPAKTKATVKSKNTKIAAVKYNKTSGKITITGKQAGSTTISVKVGKTVETIDVTVKGIPLTGLPSEVTVVYGKKKDILAPKNKGITVKSNNTKIATAKYTKSSGKITIQGKKKGTATLTVKYGVEEKKIAVNVEATTTKLKLSKKTVSLAKKGKAATISITATPKMSITGEKATVTCDNDSVIKMDYSSSKNKIKITALAKGTATITVKVGKQSQTLIVTVKK